MKRFAQLLLLALVMSLLLLLPVDANYNATPVMTPRVDGITGAAITIAYVHHEIHEGEAFTAGYSVTTAATDDHRTAIVLTVPTTAAEGRVHMTATFSATDPAEVFILEAPAFVDFTQGTTGPVLNRFRGSTNTSGVLDTEAVPAANAVETWTEAQLAAGTFLGVGDELFHQLLGGGGGPFAAGGTSRGQQEFVLEPAHTYIFYVQNIGANANTHAITLAWYEHVDGDFTN